MVTLELTAYLGQMLKQNKLYKMVIRAKERIALRKGRGSGEEVAIFKTDGWQKPHTEDVALGVKAQRR